MPLLLIIVIMAIVFFVVWAADAQCQKDNPNPRLERTVETIKEHIRGS